MVVPQSEVNALPVKEREHRRPGGGPCRADLAQTKAELPFERGDVECLDRLFETGIREASLVLAEADRREPAPLLTNARGIPLRIVQKNATNIPAPPDAVQEKAVAERSVPETAASLVMVLFLVAALAYTFVARRLAA